MNYCECGESAVDLEEYYQRGMGKVTDISRKKKQGHFWVKVDHKCKYVKREGESCTLNNKCTYPNCK